MDDSITVLRKFMNW